MTTAYITHPDCLRHDMGAGHPECPDRLTSVNDAMRAAGLLAELRCLEAPLAEVADLERVHDASYVDLIFEHAPVEGRVQLDPDTAMNSHSLDAARRAAGAGILAVDDVLSGRSSNAFCAVRPCGHHATRVRSMGFCIFNNVAVAAAYALDVKDLERVAVIDFDVHHGNGTEDMFSTPQWQNRVLMADDFYLRGFRRTSRRSTGRYVAGRGGLCVDDPEVDGCCRPSFAKANRVDARRWL